MKAWLAESTPESRHHAFPVLGEGERLLGVVTRHEVERVKDGENTMVRSLLKRPPAVAFEDSSLREAADLMVREGVGRLPVVTRADRHKVVGILTRSDLLSAHARRLDENRRRQASRINIPFVRLSRLARQAQAQTQPPAN